MNIKKYINYINYLRSKVHNKELKDKLSIVFDDHVFTIDELKCVDLFLDYIYKKCRRYSTEDLIKYTDFNNFQRKEKMKRIL